MSQPSEQLQAYIRAFEHSDVQEAHAILSNANWTIGRQIICWHECHLQQREPTPEQSQIVQQIVDCFKNSADVVVTRLLVYEEEDVRLQLYELLREDEAKIRNGLVEMMQEEFICPKHLAKELLYLNNHHYTDIPVEFHPEEHKWIDLLMSFCR